MTKTWLGCAIGVLMVAGVSGCSGTPGAEGPQGPAGPAGSTGPAGPTGPAGSTGPAGMNGSNGSDGATGPQGPAGNGKALTFAPIPIALTTLEKQSAFATSQARVNGVNVPLSYVTELRSGALVGANVFGRLSMVDGGVLRNDDGSEVVSNYADFSSLLQSNGHLYEVTHFEAQPGAMYFSEVNQAADGTLSIASTQPIDFSPFGGLWNPCAGSVSPWNTHLGSEEYPGDGRAYETGTTVKDVVGSYNTGMVRYWGLNAADAGVDEVKAVYNPYRYGFLVEVGVDAGAPVVTKHYAAGRRALELAYVMPDRKTVYLTDDGTNDAFYMFVAKNAGDLSEGRLFAARWLQTVPPGSSIARADLDWIELGSNLTDAQVRSFIESGTKFSDIFDTAPLPAEGVQCDDPTFRSINTDTGRECLRLRPDAGDVASRLESRRYAAYVGATTEFRKSEGVSFDPDTGRLYVSISEVNSGMLDNDPKRDLGGPNHVALAQNYCGAVLELTVAPNTALGSGYVAESVRTLVQGVPLDPAGGRNGSYPVGSLYDDPTATSESQAATRTNVCSVSSIANPDNITYIPGYHTLIIGEDTTDGHQNDVAWAYDTWTGELTRIFSSPYGAEVTGAYWYPNLNGHAYLKLQVQHPYTESDPEKAPSPEHRQAYVGYVGPFPRMD